MTTIRDDAQEKLSQAIIFITLAGETAVPEMRKQHLDGALRLVAMCRDSVEERDFDFQGAAEN